ncbi:Mast cell carboxypeptidase A [Geodia barretti]|uniref:Mast cell carboxypeptidase A n=1 Tax=Geodia barretti TaxID=519541 RepID=A0AA35WU74_GEOBA|nr:Mast cell carboxypeptidase A [Geodia barretti]
MKILLLLLTLAAASELYQRTEHYDDQIVVKCELKESFTERLGTLLEKDFVDLWGVDEEKRLHIRLGNQLWSELQSTLPECSVVIENVEEYVSKAEKKPFDKSNPEPSWFEAYHPYDDIVAWYQTLGKNYSGLVKYVESIGMSVEGRNIPAVHITNILADPINTVYFQCQLHAREWISAAVCMNIATYLCENYGKDEQVTKLLDSLQFVFVPIANPDGYEYTWTVDRLWRKNRRVNPGSSCMGVDLNRNYNDHWDEGGSSGSPCSQVYHGSFPASEPETQTTQAYFGAQNGVIAAVDWHAYSQLILRPYGYTMKPSPNEEQLSAIGANMSQAIYSVHGYTYTSMAASGLYLYS